MTARVEYLNPVALAQPLGFYSHVSHDPASGLVFVAGQVALGVDGVLVGVGDLAAQTRQTFENISGALASVSADWTNGLKLTTYLTHSDDYTAFRRVREEIFDALFPIRAAVGRGRQPPPRHPWNGWQPDHGRAHSGTRCACRHATQAGSR